MTTTYAIEILCRRLSDQAPKIDINPQQGCIDFIAWNSEENSIDKYDHHGKALLKKIHLRLPVSVFGFFVSANPCVVIPNPILPSGFDGALAQVKFQVWQSETTFNEGDPICSLFLMPSIAGGVRVREVEKDQLNESLIIQEVSSMELICASQTFTESRHQQIMADIQTRREQQSADARCAMRRKIREKIQLVARDDSQIPEQMIEKYIDLIIKRGDHEDRYYYHNFKILQFPTEQSLDSYFVTFKDNSGYTIYQKYKEEYAEMYYGFLTEADIKNPFD